MEDFKFIQSRRVSVRDWLCELPEDLAAIAIKNARPDRLEHYAEYCVEALGKAFIFSKSPEGQEYWQLIYRELIYIEMGIKKPEYANT